MFEQLEPKPADAILKLIGEHASDPRAEKVDLGVGVYRNAEGDTPILNCVKKAEHWLVGTQSSKAYLGSRGDLAFCDAVQEVVFGRVENDGRIATLQSPGGSGALRVAAEVALKANPESRIWVSNPTWNNHIPLLGEAGINLKSYPYYDVDSNVIQFESMLDSLQQASAGDIVLLHGCCHNPTGMDLSTTQWNQVADVIAEQQLIPFIDLAYQGFSENLDDDAYSVRLFFDRVPEMIVTQSCSKNFGLYRDRVGALSFVAKDEATAKVTLSQALSTVRTMYSLPPDHGAAVVGHILNDNELRAEWLEELSEMRARLKEMRRLLTSALSHVAPDRDFSHIQRTTGMFCYLGVTEAQVEQLKSDHGVYMVGSSRINVCGITMNNVDYLARAIAAVT